MHLTNFHFYNNKNYLYSKPIKGLSGCGVGYSFGFNGKEGDNETQTQDYGMRIYDFRLGKFLSVDPLTKEYPDLSTYQFATNNPIWNIDLDGLEGVPAQKKALDGFWTIPSDASYLQMPIIQKTTKSLIETYLPTPTGGINPKAEMSANYKKGSYKIGEVKKPEESKTNENKNMTIKVSKSTGPLNAFKAYGIGLETEDKKVEIQSVYSLKIPTKSPGPIKISSVGLFRTTFSEHNEKLSIGPVSVSSREVFQDGKKLSYDLQFGLDLTFDKKSKDNKSTGTIGFEIQTPPIKLTIKK